MISKLLFLGYIIIGVIMALYFIRMCNYVDDSLEKFGLYTNITKPPILEIFIIIALWPIFVKAIITEDKDG